MFDREAPFELRIQDPGQGPQEVGTLEAIRIKVLLLVSQSTQLYSSIIFIFRLCFSMVLKEQDRSTKSRLN